MDNSEIKTNLRNMINERLILLSVMEGSKDDHDDPKIDDKIRKVKEEIDYYEAMLIDLEKIDVTKANAETERIKVTTNAETERIKATENAKARVEEAKIKEKEESRLREEEIKAKKEKNRDNAIKFGIAAVIMAMAVHTDGVGMIHGAVLKVGEAITKII